MGWTVQVIWAVIWITVLATYIMAAAVLSPLLFLELLRDGRYRSTYMSKIGIETRKERYIWQK